MSTEDSINDMVGSVAEETARLLESLRRSYGGEDAAAGEAATDHDDEVEIEVTDADQPASGPRAREPRCECGHGQEMTGPVRMGESASCAYCPICRGVGLARTLTPETLGRLADVAALAATALTDLATRRRSEESGGGPDTHPAPASAASAASAAESIPVVDDDEDN